MKESYNWIGVFNLLNINNKYWNKISNYINYYYPKINGSNQQKLNEVSFTLKVLSRLDLSKVIFNFDIDENLFKKYNLKINLSNDYYMLDKQNADNMYYNIAVNETFMEFKNIIESNSSIIIGKLNQLLIDNEKLIVNYNILNIIQYRYIKINKLKNNLYV